MATTRKVGATRRKKRKSTVGAAAPKATIKIAGVGGKKRTYKKKMCTPNKGAAKAQATGFRTRGSTARVIESTSSGKKVYCVYVGPKAKAPFGGKNRKKKTTATVTGVRRRRRRAA